MPADYTAECSDENPMDMAAAVDNCGTVTVTVDEIVIDGACAGQYIIVRTFTATDECGNSTVSNSQMISIIDTTSPVFTSVPADYTTECSDEYVMEPATACLLYTSPSPRDLSTSRMPSSA